MPQELSGGDPADEWPGGWAAFSESLRNESMRESQSMIEAKKAKRRGQFLANMQAYLTDTRTTLMGKIAVQLQTERDTDRDVCMDSCDLASEQNQREMRAMLSERERLKVEHIDDALQQIASLKYGACETCGLDVNEERLYAMPFTRLCCDCQQEREREAKTERHYEEPDYEGYKLGSSHAEE
jgi:RNA polymerase-binding protein DksA